MGGPPKLLLRSRLIVVRNLVKVASAMPSVKGPRDWQVPVGKGLAPSRRSSFWLLEATTLPLGCLADNDRRSLCLGSDAELEKTGASGHVAVLRDVERGLGIGRFVIESPGQLTFLECERAGD